MPYKTFTSIEQCDITDLPADLRISTHICQGNYHSTWATKGYAQLRATCLPRKVDAFYLNLMMNVRVILH